MAQLEHDPEYQERKAKQERGLAERAAVYAKDEEALVAAMQAQGFEIDSVWDLVNNAPNAVLERRFLVPYTKAYPILVEHLGTTHHPKIREGIIRALTESGANEVASEALLREFESESDPNLRWVLANALRTVLTRSQKRKHPEYKEVYKGKGLP